MSEEMMRAERAGISESALTLVVSEKTLGSLTTNAIQIREAVRRALPAYAVENYSDADIERAKRDKALLNKAAKQLNSARIEIEREFMKPFGEFKEVVADTVRLIGECSSKIDAVVKASEDAFRREREREAREIFEAGNREGVPFEKAFQSKWLNKTTSIYTVKVDIKAFFERVDKDIEAIRKTAENGDFEALRAYYADTLDLGLTIQYGARLQEQRRREREREEEQRRREEISREIADEKGKIEEEERQREEERRREAQREREEKKEREQAEVNVEESEMLIRAFRVKTTREKIIALSDFMNANGIAFERIE